VKDFIEYGHWYQRQVVPQPDERRVGLIERANGGFVLRLEDGETLVAERVVVATGLAQYGSRPEPLASLPTGLVSHSSKHVDFAPFGGRSVLVVGGGQSALESAALLGEAGAEVEVLVRRAAIKWLKPDNAPGIGARVNRVILPPTDVGGRVTGWIAAAPDLYRGLPREFHPTITRRVAGPAGADWLRPRLDGVRLTLQRTVVGAEAAGDGVRVELDDGSIRSVDHVILATGFNVDVASCPFLSPPLLASLERANGYPVLGPGLESSVPGLHFMGAPASHSFGPIMRFVVGTWYAAPALTERITRRPRRPLRLSYRPRHPLSRVGPWARTR
jgi:FAD-dependent urate hydroxylase